MFACRLFPSPPSPRLRRRIDSRKVHMWWLYDSWDQQTVTTTTVTTLCLVKLQSSLVQILQFIVGTVAVVTVCWPYG